jgi:hypothetical protein
VAHLCPDRYRDESQDAPDIDTINIEMAMRTAR